MCIDREASRGLATCPCIAFIGRDHTGNQKSRASINQSSISFIMPESTTGATYYSIILGLITTTLPHVSIIRWDVNKIGLKKEKVKTPDRRGRGKKIHQVGEKG